MFPQPSTPTGGPGNPMLAPAPPPPDAQPHGGIVHQEYLNQDVNGWLVQWRQKRRWGLNVPRIKECKKRKDSYREFYTTVLFKAPYKYHVNLLCNGMKLEEAVFCQLALNFENGESIAHTDGGVLSNGSRDIKIMKFEQSTTSENTLEVTLGPFQYNVCSFRQDGRKFRVVLHLFSSILSIPHLVCSIISPPFTIRAKKPIKNPGSRRRKRARDAEPGEPPQTKRRKPAPRQRAPPKRARPPPASAHSGPGRGVGVGINLGPVPVPVPVPGAGAGPPGRGAPGVPPNFVIPYPQVPVRPPFSGLAMNLGQSMFSQGTPFAPPQQQQAMQMSNPQLQLQMSMQPMMRPRGGIPQSRDGKIPDAAAAAQGGPRANQHIDLFDFLLSEQEEPEEKQKSLTNKIVSEFSAMDTENRIDLLRKLLEISFPHELEYLRSVFFATKKADDAVTPQVFTEMDKLVSDDDRFEDHSSMLDD